MNWIKKTGVALSIVGLVFTACTNDDDNSNTEFELGNKEGIVLITFGSSFPDPQLTFANIDEAAKAKFSGEEIRWGFTSDLIINKLRQGNGEGTLEGTIIDNDTPTEALNVMVEEGYSTFALQSLHIIPGEEYDELLEAVEEFEAQYEGAEVTVGSPLLNSEDDIAAVAAILAEKFATQITQGPVCFMGHGTPHAADDRYLMLDAELKKLNAQFFVGTVEGIGFDADLTSIGVIIEQIDAIAGVTTVTISPLMSIAGDHANNDMNANTGESVVEEQSWRERLVAAGYTVQSVMKGLGDYDEINAIWMAHLEASK